MENTSPKDPFSIAMLDYRSVVFRGDTKILKTRIPGGHAGFLKQHFETLPLHIQGTLPETWCSISAGKGTRTIMDHQGSEGGLCYL